MIKWLVKFFFGKQFAIERDECVAEARVLLEKAKRVEVSHYIHYERIEPRSNAFVMGMRPLYENRYVLSWLNEHKNNCLTLMSRSLVENDKEKVLLGMSQLTMIDSLLMDLIEFKGAHDALLEEQAESRTLGGE